MQNHSTQSTQLSSAFKDFYENLPAKLQPGFISLVMQSCEVSERTVYRWMEEPNTVRALFREKIAELASLATQKAITANDLFPNQ